MITEFLARQLAENPERFKYRDHNWIVIHTDEHDRFWKVMFPQSGGGCCKKILQERLEGQEAFDLSGGYHYLHKELTDDTLRFWYDAQRDMNDW